MAGDPDIAQDGSLSVGEPDGARIGAPRAPGLTADRTTGGCAAARPPGIKIKSGSLSLDRRISMPIFNEPNMRGRRIP